MVHRMNADKFILEQKKVVQYMFVALAIHINKTKPFMQTIYNWILFHKKKK